MCGSPTVTVYVGVSKTVFYPHRDILCLASPFFDTAFTGRGTFKETAEQSITLPEENAEVFQRFIQWLYSDDCGLACGGRGEKTDEYIQLAALYILADKYDIVGLHNHVFDRLFQFWKQGATPHRSVIHFVYELTNPGSPLREVMIAHDVYHRSRDWLKKEDISEELSHCPRDYVVDLAIGFGKAFKYCADSESPLNGKPDVFYKPEPRAKNINVEEGPTKTKGRKPKAT